MKSGNVESSEEIKSNARIIKDLIAEGREKGFVTVEEINTHLATKTPSPEQLERIFNILAEIDIEVVDANKNAAIKETPEEPETPEEAETPEPTREELDLRLDQAPQQ